MSQAPTHHRSDAVGHSRMGNPLGSGSHGCAYWVGMFRIRQRAIGRRPVMSHGKRNGVSSKGRTVRVCVCSQDTFHWSSDLSQISESAEEVLRIRWLCACGMSDCFQFALARECLFRARPTSHRLILRCACHEPVVESFVGSWLRPT